MNERIGRYRDKMNYVVRNMESVQKDAESELELGGRFCGLHTAIGASMDMVAMLLKDLGNVVRDDYSNITRLAEIGIISEYFYHYRKLWDDCKHRVAAGQFESYKEQVAAIHRFNRIKSRLPGIT